MEHILLLQGICLFKISVFLPLQRLPSSRHLFLMPSSSASVKCGKNPHFAGYNLHCKSNLILHHSNDMIKGIQSRLCGPEHLTRMWKVLRAPPKRPIMTIQHITSKSKRGRRKGGREEQHVSHDDFAVKVWCILLWFHSGVSDLGMSCMGFYVPLGVHLPIIPNGGWVHNKM